MQLPPSSLLRSTTATCLPSLAAAIAAFCPAGPLPMTTTSYSRMWAPGGSWGLVRPSAGLRHPARARLAERGAPHGARERIDRGDRGQDQQHDERHLIPGVDADAVAELMADAAGADHPEDGGRADVGLEVVEDGRQPHRKDLGQHAVAEHLERARPGGPHALH